MIPPFNREGLLPPGIHWASWREIQDRYGTNSHRERLLSGLENGIKLLEIALCSALYLDGSFVTDKPFPNDYDACWEPAGVDFAALDPIFFDFKNLRAAQKARFFGEFFPANNTASLGPPFRIFLQFFQIDKDTGAPKGIVGLTLKEDS
jgi:hypothetical protein